MASKKVLGVAAGVLGVLVVLVLLGQDPDEPIPNPALQDALSADAATAGGGADISEDARNCLTRAWYDQHSGQAAEAVPPTYNFSVQIPPGNLVVWSSDSKGVIGVCVPGAVTDPLFAEITSNPYGAVNALNKYLVSKHATFEPGPKGEFETTNEYDARIAQERSVFEAEHPNTFTVGAFSNAWDSVMGELDINTVYDPDTELLKFSVTSRLSRYGAKTGVIEIPIEIKLPRNQAKAYFDAIGSKRGYGLEVEAAMEMRDGNLTIREINVKPSDNTQSVGWAQKQALEAAEISFEHLPVNYEIPFTFSQW